MKLTCDCGTELKEHKVKINNIPTEAMVCPKCKFSTLTKDQAKKIQLNVQPSPLNFQNNMLLVRHRHEYLLSLFQIEAVHNMIIEINTQSFS